MGPGEIGQDSLLTSRTQGAQLIQEGEALVTPVTRVRTGTERLRECRSGGGNHGLGLGVVAGVQGLGAPGLMP